MGMSFVPLTRCQLCPGVHNCVPADGPCNDYAFIGEGPGREEDRKLKPFQGKTGREVNEHYLPLAGLARPNVYVTNAFKCLPPGTTGKVSIDDQKDREMLMSCAEHHLYPELEAHKFKLLIPMGAFACYAIDPDINLELQHGMPVRTAWGTVFPMYNPAQGIHEPKKMLMIRTDWIRLRQYIRGTFRRPVDEFTSTDYRVINTPDELGEDLLYANEYPLACDTEITRQRKPFCLTYSTKPGTGRLIRADNKPVLDLFQHELDAWNAPIIWHNWLFDGGVVRRMGLQFPHRWIRDTMEDAFLLGNLPQGLKALAYRELGMTMQDFDDLVIPYSKPIVLDYYREAKLIDWPKPPQQMVRGDDGELKPYKPQSMSTKLKRFFTDYTKNTDKDVFKTWTDNWVDSQAEIEAQCGPWPGKCITHVPFDKVLHYACRDADATLRLWPLLNRMKLKVRRKSQEFWRDAA